MSESGPGLELISGVYVICCYTKSVKTELAEVLSVCLCMCVFVKVSLSLSLSLCIYMRKCGINVCMYECMHVCMHVCIYV